MTPDQVAGSFVHPIDDAKVLRVSMHLNMTAGQAACWQYRDDMPKARWLPPAFTESLMVVQKKLQPNSVHYSHVVQWFQQKLPLAKKSSKKRAVIWATSKSNCFPFEYN